MSDRQNPMAKAHSFLRHWHHEDFNFFSEYDQHSSRDLAIRINGLEHHFLLSSSSNDRLLATCFFSFKVAE